MRSKSCTVVVGNETNSSWPDRSSAPAKYVDKATEGMKTI